MSAVCKANDDVWCVGGERDRLGGLCRPVGAHDVALIYPTSPTTGYGVHGYWSHFRASTDVVAAISTVCKVNADIWCVGGK